MYSIQKTTHLQLDLLCSMIDITLDVPTLLVLCITYIPDNIKFHATGFFSKKTPYGKHEAIATQFQNSILGIKLISDVK